jgi:hypothetical protein
MTKKKSFVLRLNAETYDALEKWSADEFRSTNGQLEYLINEALKKAGRLPKRDLRRETEDMRQKTEEGSGKAPV